MSNNESNHSPPSDFPNKVSRHLPIVQNPDGSMTRLAQLPTVPATPDPDSSSPVLSRDASLNPQRNTWVRIFRPRHTPVDKPSKLSLIVYFHGGGFIICSAATEGYHNFCTNMAAQVGAIVVSVEYRLAPEHRLPAAYEDALDALHWIKTSRDTWLHDFADLTKCFLVGSSAGGNIVYHAALRAAMTVDEIFPVKIRGLILHQPGFGGTQATESELRLANDRIIPQRVVDVIWKLSLPVGADHDHEYCNPAVGGGSPLLERVRELGWRLMVTGCEGDPLIDRQKEFAKMLEGKGVQVVTHFTEGGCHGVELVDPTRTNDFVAALKGFVDLVSSDLRS